MDFTDSVTLHVFGQEREAFRRWRQQVPSVFVKWCRYLDVPDVGYHNYIIGSRSQERDRYDPGEYQVVQLQWNGERGFPTRPLGVLAA